MKSLKEKLEQIQREHRGQRAAFIISAPPPSWEPTTSWSVAPSPSELVGRIMSWYLFITAEGGKLPPVKSSLLTSSWWSTCFHPSWAGAPHWRRLQTLVFVCVCPSRFQLKLMGGINQPRFYVFPLLPHNRPLSPTPSHPSLPLAHPTLLRAADWGDA